MANNLYDKAREAFSKKQIDWLNDDFRVVLVTSAYVVDLAAHDFLDDIAGGARVATSGALAGKTAVGGVCDADDKVFTGLTGSTVVAAIIVGPWTGADATTRLLAYIDTATGLPYIPNGTDLTVTWGNTATKIFKL